MDRSPGRGIRPRDCASPVSFSENAVKEIKRLMNEENISDIISVSGAGEIHFSASIRVNAYDNTITGQTTTQTDLQRATKMVSLAREAFNR